MKDNVTKNAKKNFITDLITPSLSHFVTLIICLFALVPMTYAFEDVIITNNSKLSDIKIEDHDIIDVFPLITIMNDKNTLIVHPLKEGKSEFAVLKDGKKLVKFSVKVEADETKIEPVDGFEILTIDYPPNIFEYELDEPPVKFTK